MALCTHLSRKKATQHPLRVLWSSLWVKPLNILLYLSFDIKHASDFFTFTQTSHKPLVSAGGRVLSSKLTVLSTYTYQMQQQSPLLPSKLYVYLYYTRHLMRCHYFRNQIKPQQKVLLQFFVTQIVKLSGTEETSSQTSLYTFKLNKVSLES